ncbi:hypothetical protein J2X69_004549 [Algoriphagus sp. 4150]|nr:hypothetical protein [Algoriphagus sp. 4150]
MAKRNTQAKHKEDLHKKQCFLDEYEDLLKTHEIKYDKRYIFKPIEE